MVQERLKLSGVTFVSVSVPSCGSASEGERNTGEERALLNRVGELATRGYQFLKPKLKLLALFCRG